MLDFFDGRVLPISAIAINRHEGTRGHPVDVEAAVEMIDFVLKNSRVPTGGFDSNRFGALIKTIHRDCAGAAHQRHESSDAETAFEKLRNRAV